MRALILIGFCCALVSAGYTYLTVTDASRLINSAIARFKSFSKHGNTFPADVPPFSDVFQFQGYSTRIEYTVDPQAKTFTATIPTPFVMENKLLPELKEFFHRRVVEAFPGLQPQDAFSDLDDGSMSATITWPSDQTYRNMYTFIYNFHTLSDYETPKNFFTHLKPDEFLSCANKAMERFNKFVGDGNKDTSPLTFSMMSVGGKDMGLSYSIDTANKVFKATIPDEFVVSEKDLPLFEKELQALAMTNHLSNGITSSREGRRALFIASPPEAEHFTFALSFPVSPFVSRAVSLLLKQLVARLFE